MNVSDDELLSYLDGELDSSRRSALAGLIAADPQLAIRIAAQHRADERVRRALNHTLDEPLPDRLVATAARFSRGVGGAPVRRRWASTGWLAVAASIALLSFLVPQAERWIGGDSNLIFRADGLAASGELAHALSNQLAATQTAEDPIQLRLSFVANSRQYCRVFVSSAGKLGAAGIACRDGDIWRIRILESEADTGPNQNSFRQAATPLSPTLLSVIDDSIAGEALDARAEASASARGWRNVPSGEGVKSATRP